MRSTALFYLLVLTATARAQEVVRFVQSHRVTDIQKYRSGESYRNCDCAFRDDETFLCVHPTKRGGELQFCSIRKNEVVRTAIPEPKAFKPKFDWDHYFHGPHIWPNARGDLFILWTVGGNGEHGLALHSKESNKFRCDISYRPLQSFSKAVGDADGSWYLVRWAGDLAVYRVDVEKEFDLEALGFHEGLGYHRYGVVDACLRAKGILHCIYAQVEEAIAIRRLRFHAVDFDIAKKSWSERRTLFDQNDSVSSAHPRVVMLEGKPHYFWSIDWRKDKTPGGGLHYLADGKTTSVRLADSRQFEVLAIGKKIVVCYTIEGKIDQVFFRVIEAGIVGPESSVKISNRYDYSLWGEDMVLGNAGRDRLWFVNAKEINKFYELKIERP